jgi:large subunit ribosomal protein L22
MKAVVKTIRISPKKLNLVASLVRNKDVQDAIDILKFTPKKGALPLSKAIKSAAANAENNFKQKKATLFIKEIIVNKGPTYKRSVPISRGRVHPILKRNAHLTVTIGVKEQKVQEKKTEKPKKEEPKTTVKSSPKKLNSK